MHGFQEIDFSRRTQNKDLVWDLESFSQRRTAHEFVMHFENKICVFSPSVEQIYSNYSITFPAEENKRLIILPNPSAHHDIFQSIPEGAVKPTGLYIVPSRLRELNLRIPLKTQDAPWRDVPLHVGLKLINSRRPRHLPLLPILVKGDLRELDSRTPVLHLHAVSLSALSKLSSLELNAIRKVILDRIGGLL
ncbi:MAG TPA: hypothetical protein VIZ65_01485 [Cellvibrionaceae bacterium]